MAAAVSAGLRAAATPAIQMKTRYKVPASFS